MFFIFPSYESSLYLTALEAIYSTTNPKTGLYFPTKSQERERRKTIESFTIPCIASNINNKKKNLVYLDHINSYLNSIYSS
jgi:hypothetical protein